MMYLEGVTVLDLTQWLPGPYCTMLLGDLGARVIKIERPGDGDPARTTLPGIQWIATRHKESLALDLKAPGSREVMRRLVGKADVLVEGFRPGVMDRLALGYATLSQSRPDLVYCSISGYGQHGPLRDRPGHDINYLAQSGALAIAGELGERPHRSGLPVSDLAAAMFAALSIVAAVHRSRTTGLGDYLDVGMADAAFAWTATRLGDFLENGTAPRDAYDFGHLAPANQAYQTRDGRWIAFGAVEEKFWIELCSALGHPDWPRDSRFATGRPRREHAEVLMQLIQAAVATRTLSEWATVLEPLDLPWAPVADPADLANEPHIVARHLVEALDGGGAQVPYPVPSPSGGVRPPTRPPALGSASDAILHELGFTRAEIEAMKTDRLF